MSVEIFELVNVNSDGWKNSHGYTFFCNTTDVAFGPLMDTLDEAEGFLHWLDEDPRVYTDSKLWDLLIEYRTRA